MQCAGCPCPLKNCLYLFFVRNIFFALSSLHSLLLPSPRDRVPKSGYTQEGIAMIMRFKHIFNMHVITCEATSQLCCH